MILYRVSPSGIVELDVKNETKCGWTQHNRGFIRRCELRKYSRYTSGNDFYTTDKDEAVKWGITLRDQMLADYNKLEFDIEYQSCVETPPLMTNPTQRTIQDPTLGTITVHIDADELRLVITWEGYGFGWQYDDVAVLAARYTEITDAEILVLVQTASDEINGTSDRVLH